MLYIIIILGSFSHTDELFPITELVIIVNRCYVIFYRKKLFMNIAIPSVRKENPRPCLSPPLDVFSSRNLVLPFPPPRSFLRYCRRRSRSLVVIWLLLKDITSLLLSPHIKYAISFAANGVAANASSNATITVPAEHRVERLFSF